MGVSRTLEDAQRPAMFEGSDPYRVLVFATSSTSSGIPPEWSATENRHSVHLIDEPTSDTASQVQQVVAYFAPPNDLIMFPIYRSPN